MPGAPSNTVHPRLRGELICETGKYSLEDGSSPLTRGTQLAIRQRERGRRFIPAYAGNSRVRESLLFDSAVHPRLRGELKVKVKKVFILLGSSPLTRGTHQSIDEVRVNARFIPAYAGNSVCVRHQRPFTTVHPRLRGELFRFDIANRDTLRFIPAYAGNSEWRLRSRLLQPVHPRLRGELIQQTDDENSTGGSSPLTRGTRNAVALIVFFARFIPAYAGNSSPGIGGILAVIGSSPLTRGTHLNKA